MEDDHGPKFIKSIPKEKAFQWTPQNFMSHINVPQTVIDDTVADPGKHYSLLYGPDGVPMLPKWSTHPSITKWRKPFGKYLRYFWCK